ncbi:MAG TPA: hypothetical protein VK003_21290 [Oceanobacillus sp.]|nr:hypothetical protein [Oceanobacillus sp.]
MPFDFRWDNDDKTIMRYVASGAWNWNEFHKNMRRSTLWFDQVSHPVDVIVDLRGGNKLPAGAIGHLRSLGTKIHANSTGRAVILGVDAETQRKLGAVDGVYDAGERQLRFVETDEAAYRAIEGWRMNDR